MSPTPRQLAGQRAQQQQNKSVKGTIDHVPCPHCGKPNDLRVLKSEQLLDTGHQIFCDWCKHSFEVTAIRTFEIIAVRKDPSGKRLVPRLAATARNVGRRQLGQQTTTPGFFQRLLGK